MPDRVTRIGHAWPIYAVVGLVTVPMIVAALAQSVVPAPRVALYASVGEELITFGVDVDRATLTRRASIALPGFVQEAWASPSSPFLYVAWSNGGASYAGSGVEPRGDKHGVTAFRVDATGGLHAAGMPAQLRARPIHITGDVPGRHLLVAYNDPSGISVHTINSDGTIGSEVPQAGTIDAGIYGHQVRVVPDNRTAILVTRGNQPTSTTKEDPGALKVFHYDNGKLSNEMSIAPAKGIGFRSRHLDFHPTGPWVYLTLESQNTLDVFRRTADGLSADPIFSKSTLEGRSGVINGQTASTIHVHPNGQFVYVGNRGGAGGSNNIAVFRINQQTGEPTLMQNIDTHGSTPRTFSLDHDGRLLVVGNQNTTDTLPANLAVFRIQPDGRLEFANRYDIAVGRKPLWWTGLVALR
jgi:6-phosphogluconolactonase (cycloisomerase 2 family)